MSPTVLKLNGGLRPPRSRAGKVKPWRQVDPTDYYVSGLEATFGLASLRCFVALGRLRRKPTPTRTRKAHEGSGLSEKKSVLPMDSRRKQVTLLDPSKIEKQKMAEVEPVAKRQRTDTATTSPRTIVTWNCNGFTSRSRWNAADMKKLVEDTEYPDMICIQEARLKSYDQHSRGRPMQSEYVAIQEALDTIFQAYQPVWSLADNKYAGTLTLVHNHLKLNVPSQCAFSVEWAMDLLLTKFKVARGVVGLETSSVSSPAKKVVKQTSMKAFFAPKKTVASGNESLSCSGKHHPEGRFQFFSFADMDVIQTYVPNNGTKEESFCRRRDWDESMLKFLKDRRKLLEHCQKTDRPLLWCGDFNVAREYRDGTHWEKRPDGSIYEFWTDPEKCFVGKKGSVPTPDDPDNIGIPSFTVGERKRFAALLQGGDFVDVWRALHPNGVADSTLSKWDRPDYTWRGHLAKSDGYNAKFQGKGQRLDYFLLNPSKLIKSVQSCEILGYGEQRRGHYCGSDHCAVQLRLSEKRGVIE